MDELTDHYTTLQVAPEADHEQIEQAYRRAIEQYNPEKLAGLASELQALARERRRAIDEAYAVLSDPVSRAAYDAEIGQQTQAVEERADAEEIDYRPLPPRRGSASPTVRAIAGQQRSLPGPRWLPAVSIVAVLLALVSAGTLMLTAEKRNAPQLTVEEMRAIARQTLLPPAVTAEIRDPVVLDFLTQQEQTIAELDQRANESKSFEDWVALGNAIFDYLEIIREQNPSGQAYAAVAPRWLKAAEAYAEALKQQPKEGELRSDYALSLLRLWQAIGDESLRGRAVSEAEQALSDDPGELRTILNVGMVLNSVPERREDARKLLQQIIDRAPSSREASVAQQILEGEAP